MQIPNSFMGEEGNGYIENKEFKIINNIFGDFTLIPTWVTAENNSDLVEQRIF